MTGCKALTHLGLAIVALAAMPSLAVAALDATPVAEPVSASLLAAGAGGLYVLNKLRGR